MGTEPTPGRRDGWTRRRVLLGAAGASMAGLAGCIVHGRDSGLEGEIVVDGSNTLRPTTALVAELFMWENNQVEIPIRPAGTGAGFQQFCRGETDLQNASREIATGERDLCDDNGVDWFRLDVVMDGIAIMKHEDNDRVESLTTDQLRELWQRDSDVETWQDLDGDWPDEEISLYGRDTASGTFDYFTETITGDVGNIRADYSGTPDTNAIIRGVRGDQYAVGFGGMGYYEENQEGLDLIGVEDTDTDTDGPVFPDEDTIREGTYSPLSRPMFLYVREAALEREEVRRFLRFYLDNVQDAARDTGFFEIPDETIAEQHAKLDEKYEAYE